MKSHRRSLTSCSIKVSLQSGHCSCFCKHYKFWKNILSPRGLMNFLYAARWAMFLSLQAVLPRLNESSPQLSCRHSQTTRVLVRVAVCQ